MLLYDSPMVAFTRIPELLRSHIDSPEHLNYPDHRTRAYEHTPITNSSVAVLQESRIPHGGKVRINYGMIIFSTNKQTTIQVAGFCDRQGQSSHFLGRTNAQQILLKGVGRGGVEYWR
jgi:hypothetical protein